MIGKIKGKVAEIENSTVLIETKSGIFFNVYLPLRILPVIKIGDRIEVYIYLYIHNDNVELYGFKTRSEYNLFKLLLSVPGVGAKIAFSIISYTDEKKITNAIKEKNVEFFDQIPGIGKKTIFKIILELSSKLENNIELKSLYLPKDLKIVADALSSLGYKNSQIRTVLPQISKNLSIEEKIKQALKMIK